MSGGTRRTSRLLLQLARLGALAGFCFGYLGALHPFFDSFAPFRLHLLAVVVALSLLLGWRRMVVAAILVVIVAQDVFATGAPVAGEPLTAWSHNLRFDNPAPLAEAERIRAADPDLVMLQEVSTPNAAIVEALADRYEGRLICPGVTAVGGPAVMAREAFLDQGCELGLAWARIETVHGPLTVASLHVHWPWPFEQAEDIARLSAVVETLPRPLIVAGDFNNSAWSHAVHAMSDAAAAQAIPGWRNTFPSFAVHLDHVLLGAGWTGEVDVRAVGGSDHTALLTRFGPR
ncbi:endonuclease/exonuclease/phosphatase family protein [Pontivivens ytuae]|uniref:Endonuclease/exonuclease/phosphatase family protein n=1 Tax=Pontivivens ytuae TaxID=2789856 RepID=A0A7S9QCK5_9RHOB|nr:endonuclease/exonuclease/phosphatase family protein [Pontivivens ytuae]QPH54318.1 endonuclease/exonuclease/phosphatase family protein [Pontivivens ytuae]